MYTTRPLILPKLLIFNIIVTFLGVFFSLAATAGEGKGPAILVNPDPKQRTIPELSCEWRELGAIDNESLKYRHLDVNMRLRLRGQFLYLRGGSDAQDERLIGVITRIERRRWQSDHHLIILDESLDKGTFLTIEDNETKIRPITCKPIDTSLR